MFILSVFMFALHQQNTGGVKSAQQLLGNFMFFFMWSHTDEVQCIVKVKRPYHLGTYHFINNPYSDLTSDCDPGMCTSSSQQEAQTWWQHLLNLQV